MKCCVTLYVFIIFIIFINLMAMFMYCVLRVDTFWILNREETEQDRMRIQSCLKLLGHMLWRSRIRRPHKAIRVVDLCGGAEQFLFALLVGQVAAQLVAVGFGLQDGDEVDAGPDFLTAEFADSGALAQYRTCVEGNHRYVERERDREREWRWLYGETYLASRMPTINLYQP